MPVIRENLVLNEKLIWQPSGLKVQLLHIDSPSTARIVTERGTEFTVQMANLEHLPAADVDQAAMFDMVPADDEKGAEA